MENMKRSLKLKKIKKLSIFPFLTNICLVIVLLTQRWWGFLSNPAVILISACIFLNFVPLYYYSKKENTQKTYNPSNFKQIVTTVFIIFVAIIGIFLILFVPKLLEK